MTDVIKQAIELRKAEKHAESRALLEPLLKIPQLAATAHLNIAWSYDNEGNGSSAIPHYLLSLEGKLTRTETFDALFGLASTYRSKGDYHKALEYFELTLKEYPDSLEVFPFYAMCLYNLGQSKKAVKLLLYLLIQTTDDEQIKAYRGAILTYADDLDKRAGS